MKKNISRFLIVFLVFQFCLIQPLSVSAASKMKINKNIVSLKIGDTVQLKISHLNGKKVTWSSNKDSVAAVSKTGKVVAKSAGAATVTGKVGSKKFRCIVKVMMIHLYDLPIFHSASWHDSYKNWETYSDALGNYFPNSIIVTYDGANENPNNSLEYYIGEKYKLLHGQVAFRSENVREIGNLQLVVYGDETELYRSEVLNERTVPETFDINVENVSFLKFTVEIVDGENNKSGWYNDLILVDPTLK